MKNFIIIMLDFIAIVNETKRANKYVKIIINVAAAIAIIISITKLFKKSNKAKILNPKQN